MRDLCRIMQAVSVSYELPTYQYSFSRATFVIRSLYNFR